MKLRIRGNSVRLRLTQTDVRKLGETGRVKETTSFGKSVFTYQLQRTEQEEMTAHFEQETITVLIPAPMVDMLVNTGHITYDAKQGIGNEETLYILVEKDFQCIDQTAEDQSDMYLNPNQAC